MDTKSALVVDDSKSARFALRRHLEHHAYQVETAESAEVALSLLKRTRPQVIFLDHFMPGIDGFEALQQIRSNPATGKIPVVICSSNEGDEFTRQARSRGATDVLQKPPSPDRLAQILDRLRAAPPAVAAREGARTASRDFSIELAQLKQRIAAAAVGPERAAPTAAPSGYTALQQQIAALEQNLLAQLSELSRQVDRLMQRQPATEQLLESLARTVAERTAEQVAARIRAELADPGRGRQAG